MEKNDIPIEKLVRETDAMELENIHPNSSHADYIGFGDHFAFEDHLEKSAINEYTFAVRTGANDLERSTAYGRRARPFNELKDYRHAVADATQAIQLNSNNSEAYTNRGWAYRELGDEAKAFADLDKAIELDTNNAEAYYHRGLALVTFAPPTWSDNDDRSIEDFSRAIAINPQHGSAYLAHANALTEKFDEDYEGAILDYLKAIEISKVVWWFEEGASSKTRLRLAECYRFLQQYAPALEQYNEILGAASKEKTIAAYYLRGNLLMICRKFSKAIADLTAYLELATEEDTENEDHWDHSANAHQDLACIYIEQKQFALALAHFTQEAALRSKTDCDDLAYVHYARGDYVQALTTLTRPENNPPFYLNKYYSDRATISYVNGDYQQAIADCSYAVDADEHAESDLYFTRAQAHHALGNYEQAAADYHVAFHKWLKDGCATTYDDPQAINWTLNRLAMAYAKLGQWKNAARYFNLTTQFGDHPAPAASYFTRLQTDIALRYHDLEKHALHNLTAAVEALYTHLHVSHLTPTDYLYHYAETGALSNKSLSLTPPSAAESGNALLNYLSEGQQFSQGLFAALTPRRASCYPGKSLFTLNLYTQAEDALNSSDNEHGAAIGTQLRELAPPFALELNCKPWMDKYLENTETSTPSFKLQQLDLLRVLALNKATAQEETLLADIRNNLVTVIQIFGRTLDAELRSDKPITPGSPLSDLQQIFLPLTGLIQTEGAQGQYRLHYYLDTTQRFNSPLRTDPVRIETEDVLYSTDPERPTCIQTGTAWTPDERLQAQHRLQHTHGARVIVK